MFRTKVSGFRLRVLEGFDEKPQEGSRWFL